MPAAEAYPVSARQSLQERFDWAAATIQARRSADTPVKRQMADVALRYNGDYVMPMLSNYEQEEHPVVSATLIADAIDSVAMKANDSFPVLMAPSIGSGKRAAERAKTRRRVISARWWDNTIDIKLGRAYRHLAGYASFCITVRPDIRNKRPVIQVRNPLYCYPEQMEADEVRPPANIGFVFGRSREWILSHFGSSEAVSNLVREVGSDDVLWDLMEWWDEEWWMIGILGQRRVDTYSVEGWIDGPTANGRSLLLAAYPNRAGRVTTICPSAVTLDKQISAITKAIPIYDVLNNMTALDIIAKQRGVFPDLYAIGENNQTPQIIGGQWKPGASGEINLLQGVRTVGALTMQSNPQTQTALANLERSARLTTGNPSVFQGEASGSIRSGQTISQLGAYSVDPRTKEMHRTMRYALTHVNSFIADVEKAYWPRRQYTVFSGWNGDEKTTEYTPEDIWEDGAVVAVEYPMPGMDDYNATISLTTMVESNMISNMTARAKHPNVPDPELEEQIISSELVQQAIQQSFAQQVQTGSLAIQDLARIKELMDGGAAFIDAVIKANEEAQERQAAQVEPTDPAAQPGLAPAVTAGAEAGIGAPPPAGPPPDLASMFAALGAPPPGGA